MKTNSITRKLTMLIISGIVIFNFATTLAQKGSNFIAAIELTAPSCYGSSDGVIAINVQGGVAPYSYLWNNGSTTATLNNLSSGTYNITITDSIGSLIESIINLDQPQPIQIFSSIIPPSSMISSDGQIDVTINGGSPLYTFLWGTMNGSILQIAEEDQINLGIGNYSLTVTDNNGCKAKKQFKINYNYIGEPIYNAKVLDSNIEIFPNPSSGEVHFIVEQEITKYEIYNSNGNLVETIETDPNEVNDRTMNFEAGNYTVLFYSMKGVYKTKKLMVK